MGYYAKYDYIMIRRHWIIMLFRFLIFFLFLFIVGALLYISIVFREPLWEDLVVYLLFPIIFILLNYAFLKLILYYIEYYNNLIILHKDQIIVIKSTLLEKDYVEMIDIHRITKLDTYCKWIIPNILWYGALVIEQQRDKVREFNYIPKPYKAINVLKESKRDLIKGET